MIGGLRGNPRAIGIGCAITAVALGMGYMAAAGASARLLIVNGGAVALGLMLMAAVRHMGPHARGGVAAIVIGAALLSTALFGVTAEGVTRWASLGPILLQPSLILLPMLILAFARARGPGSTIGIVLAALALALQPDRAMAGTLGAAMAVLALGGRDRWAYAGLAAALVAFGVTLARPDLSPAVPFVDGIFYSAFDVSSLAGLAVAGGAALLLVPAIAAFRSQETRMAGLVFGATWFAIIAAAALGNYPTPLVGYGGSAVIGYLLGLAILPRAARQTTALPDTCESPADGKEEASLTAALA